MEKQLLENAGHEVVTYERHNDEIGSKAGARVQAALDATWSVRSFRDVSKLLKKHRPNVAHFHNTFPLISPSAYHACRQHNVPVVQTLHNYRLICPGALLLRDNLPCEQCVGHTLLPALRHGCYRKSRAATAVVATMLMFNRARDSYGADVSRYIALTEFARERFVRGGLPSAKITVRPNFMPTPPALGRGDGNFALYVGRLTPEKGVATLVKAWRDQTLPLKIVGDGFLRGELETLSRLSHANIEFLGFRPREDVWALMQQAKLVVIPSECYEGFPVTVLEALATGAPMVVSALGALDELVIEGENGVKFPPRNSDALSKAVTSLLAAPETLAAIRATNRARYDRQYSPSLAVSSLISLYEELVHHAAPTAIRTRAILQSLPANNG